MKLFKSIIVGIMLVGLCAACASKLSLDPALLPTAEYLEQNPLPTPPFMIGSYPGAMIDGSPAKCLAIFQSDLHSDTLAQVRIDTKSAEKVEIWDSGQAVVIDFPNVYSSHRDFCFAISNLSVGLHLGNIEFIAATGEKHHYLWSFHISEHDLNPNPAPLLTPVVLPSLTPASTPKR